MNIIGKKYWYFAISLFVLVPGLIALFLFGLNRSIDFSGGSRITLTFKSRIFKETTKTIQKELTKEQVKDVSLQASGNTVIVRSSPITEAQHATLLQDLHKDFGAFREDAFETIGPIIGSETTINALKAIVVASILIILYIAWSFRKVPRPASSVRFGVCAILALVHDVLVVVGIFAILGHFFRIEVDSLFVTALLTVIGFSVHDTIVVFDRIRENLRRMGGMPFDQVVNASILQTLDRSLNTSLTVLLVLLAMLLFGGESIRWFIIALLIGIVSGTYSSIFNASPLLVLWHELSLKRKKNI